MTLHYNKLNYITLYCIALHCIALHCIVLHYIALQRFHYTNITSYHIALGGVVVGRGLERERERERERGTKKENSGEVVVGKGDL